MYNTPKQNKQNISLEHKITFETQNFFKPGLRDYFGLSYFFIGENWFIPIFI